jgi:DNA-binding GntR family transcriptional regulator
LCAEGYDLSKGRELLQKAAEHGKTTMARAKRTKHAKRHGDADSGQSPEAEIHRRIHAAIAAHKLLPGARLVEEELCSVFGVSRMRIRAVLHALARDKVVTLHPNRGAVVASPTVEEAKDVFAARKLLEIAMAPDVVEAADDDDIRRLKEHVRIERQGERSDDRAFELKASHEFHTLLAEIPGNPVIIAFMRELMARSALITAIYERPDVSTCSHAAHGALIKLIERRDTAGLAKAMRQHLEQIESDLALFERAVPAADLKAVFTGS